MIRLVFVDIEDIDPITTELSDEDIDEIKRAKQKDPTYSPPLGISREQMMEFIQDTLVHNGIHEFQDIMSYKEIYKMYNAVKIVDQKFKTLKQVMVLRKEVLNDALDSNVK